MIPLLKKLISIKSLSKEENEIANFLFDYLEKEGFNPKRIKNNVYFKIGSGGKTLLLNSHLDTVPENNSWTKDPHNPTEENGKIYGLGSSDAKASIVTMIHALKEIKQEEINGTIIFAATSEEEISGENGAVLLFPQLGKIDAAIIGEPTSGKVCIAQKGLGYIKITSIGKSAHASIPDKGKNAIHGIPKILEIVKEIKFSDSQYLGKTILTPTLINGGIKTNIIPDSCEITFDVRTSDKESVKEIGEILANKLGSEYKVEVLTEIISKSTDDSESIVNAAIEVSENKKAYGFRALTDAISLNCPFIIYGPGKLENAHIADEYLDISELKSFKENYKNLIINYFNL